MLLPLTLALALFGQAAPATEGDTPQARLAYMKGSVTSYRVVPPETGAEPFRLEPEPIFRLNNPVGVLKDGTIFLWTGESGRPEAAVQVFLIPDGIWLHEFTSLSAAPFAVEGGGVPSPWRPARPGLAFQPVPGAPKPAATAEQRLRQLRAMAQDFAADDNFEGKGWTALRLLPRPLLRYGRAGSSIEDGALFAFALATDPEVFLMIEARKGTDGYEWQYAFAPMSSYELRGSHKGKAAWSLPWRKDAKDPGATFYDMIYARAR